MLWKMFTFIAALTCVVTTAVLPTLVEAQEVSSAGMADATPLRTLTIVGLGKDQTLEGYWVIRSAPASSSTSSHSEPPLEGVSFILLLNNPSVHGTCTETVQARVNAHPGINIFQIKMGEGNENLLVNGEEAARLPLCFQNAKRVTVGWTYQLLPFIEESQLPVTPNGGPLGFANVAIVGSSVVNLDGSTAASASVSPINHPLIVTRDADF